MGLFVNQTARNLLEKGLIVVAILVLLWCTAVAAAWGFADYYANQAYLLMEGWGDDEFVDEQWQQAHQALQKALVLEAGHPTYQARMGRLYHIRLNIKRGAREPIGTLRELGELARTHYRRSIEQRQYWPLTWAHLALLKRDLAEFDAELDEAIEKATRYGPWEPNVHRAIASVGLSNWYGFSPETRVLIAANVARGLLSPGGGASQRVYAIMQRHPSSLSGEMLVKLKQVMLEQEWTARRESIFAELTFTLWSSWSAAARSQLLKRFVARVREVKNPNRLVRVAAKYKKLPLICPQLPRTERFKRLCSNARMTF